MANRVTTAELKEIVDTSETDLDIFITAANVIVTDYLTSESLSSDLMKQIEKYLAAHIFASTNKGREAKKIKFADNFEEEYELPKAVGGLKSTSYGQIVLLLDTSGELSNIGMKSAEITAIDLDLRTKNY